MSLQRTDSDHFQVPRSNFLYLTLVKQVHALPQGFACFHPVTPDHVTLRIDAESFQFRVQVLLEVLVVIRILLTILRHDPYSFQPVVNNRLGQSRFTRFISLFLRQLPCVILNMGVHRPITKPTRHLPRTRRGTLLKEELVVHAHPLFLVDCSPFGIQHHLQIKFISISLDISSNGILNSFVLGFVPIPKRCLSVPLTNPNARSLRYSRFVIRMFGDVLAREKDLGGLYLRVHSLPSPLDFH